MSGNNQQSYGIKCEPDTLTFLNSSEPFHSYSDPFSDVNGAGEPRINVHAATQQELVDNVPANDMDLTGFLDVDDKNLSELTGGMNVSEWNTLFNGQLDGLESLDPMTGIQNSTGGGVHGDQVGMPASNLGMGHSNNNSSGMDVWLLQETQRLERQQKIQQQKLLELQQTLIKTEILKNQLQIANISQGQPSVSSPPTVLNTEGQAASFNFTPSMNHSKASTLGTPSPRVQSGLGLGNQSPCVGSPTTSVTSASGPVSSPHPPSNLSPSLIETKPFIASMAPDSPLEGPVMEGDKRKVHNLIEKKYRCSINDRIGILRDKVSRNCKDSKRLQKSAVLQKTIDFIEHLEKTISRLEQENRQLRDALAKATSKPRLPSFSSPPATPHTLISPKSLDSEDSGHSSADDYFPDETSRETSPHISQNAARPGHMSLLASHLMQGHKNPVPQYLMVVMLVAIFFVNPLALISGSSGLQFSSHSVGSARSLSSYEGEVENNLAVYWALWVFRLSVAVLCFGWATLKCVPNLSGSTQEAVGYWRLRRQADRDMQNGEYLSARESLEDALTVVGRPLPSSYFGLVIGLVWSLLSHLLFQVVVGQWAVSLASVFVCGVGGAGDKKQGPPVLATDIAKTYHLLHQINMASTSHGHLFGTDVYLALSALNFAESARPFGGLTSQQFAELYFSFGLQCHSSLPWSGLLKRYYFYAFRTLTPGKSSSPLKWAWSPEGQLYLQNGDWTSEVKLGTRLFQGEAALPLYSVSRGFCKTLLCDTFNMLLLSDSAPSQSIVDKALESFKWVLGAAKDLNSYLLSCQEGGDQQLSALSQTSDSGFTSIQWWSSVGIVASYWSLDLDSRAESFYAIIEGQAGDGSAIPSTLQLAFKTALTHKRDTSVEVLLQLCSLTSNSLTTSVSELLNDNFTSKENQLYRLGLLLATDWLLGVRVSLWEAKGRNESVVEIVRPGFYQDLETLSKLVGLLPAGLSRLRMYKGCYQLLAGANPMTVHALLGTSGYSRLRRRANGKEPSLDKYIPLNSLGPSYLEPTPRTLQSTPV